MKFTTLIDAVTLSAHLGQSDWCIFDVRHQLADVGYGERAYAAGHIPGALFLHCDRDLSGEKTGRNGRHPLPDPQTLATKLANAGLSESTQVVIYDDAQGMIAGRLWWMLRWLGHDRVAVLDGGLNAWQAVGGTMTDQVVRPLTGNFRARITVPVVGAAEILQNLVSAQLRVVDARSPDRFRGENETIDPIGGHIPGAVNRFFRDNLGLDGCFKPIEQLRREWLDVLEDGSPHAVVHQCGSGISACHNLLAMEHAGLHGSNLYVGSWSEWCADPGRPISQ